ncbi:hypothetical protein M770_35405 (plasmid) [Pseudomonas aeruginosa VRFPA03]|nr:hypothetical protein M770_35405 [Pseudomonas aeruginosa VRFPA03]
MSPEQIAQRLKQEQPSRREQLPGEYRLGYYYSTAKADDVYDDVDGQPQGLTGNDFKSRGSKHGWWVVAQQQVTSHNGDASRGLSLFANLTVHDKATNVVDNYQQLGVVYKGPFDARPKDDIGLGIARIHVNDDVKKRQRLVNQVNGIDDYDNPLYQPLQDTEYNAELYYGVHVTDWLTVRPNLQYIKQPGGVPERRDGSQKAKQASRSFLFFIGNQDAKKPALFHVQDHRLICTLHDELVFPAYSRTARR